MADERAVGSHVVPSLTAALQAAVLGRPAPRVVAGIPVCLCADHEVDAAVARTNRILAEAEVSPNYQKLLEHAATPGRWATSWWLGVRATIDRRPPFLCRRRRDRYLGASGADRGMAATS